MEYRERLLIRFMTALVTSVILFLPLFAFAGGTGNEPMGVEDYLIGVQPPPSMAAKVYLGWYHAGNLKNNSGNTMTLARDGVALDKLNVYVDANRFFYVSPIKLEVGPFTGFLGGHAIFPLVKVNQHVDVLTPGGPIDADSGHSGLADVTFGPGIGWHLKEGWLHFITAVDIVAPAGLYDRRNPLVSPGQNVWTIAPGILWTVFPPFYQNIDISMRLFYSFNTKNNDFIGASGFKTDKTPGQELVIDYDIMHAIWGGKPGMQARGGIGGYFYQQTTKDKFGDPLNEDHLGRVFAIGPALMFDYKMWIFSAHVYWEMAAKNRPEGIHPQLTVLCKF